MRSTGKPVEGHVEADSEEWAFHALANNGIITESLRPDPQQPVAPPPQPVARSAEPLLGPYHSAPYVPPTPTLPSPSTLSAPAPARPANPPGTFAVGGGATTSAPAAASTAQPAAGSAPANGAAETRTRFDSALEGALDGASSQIDFDALTERYRGKKVWVIDRDKIRRNVARVADQAIAQSLVNDEGTAATRERVADAINELFKDTRNLTSQHTATNTSLEKQISRLASVIKQFEASMAQMQSAIRNIGSGGGGGYGPRRSRGAPEGQKQEQNAVLLEIFKTNLDLLRGMEEEMRVASGTALDAVITDTEGGEGSDGGAEAPQDMTGEPEPAVAQSGPDSDNNG